MPIETVIAEIDAEIARLQQAKTLLRGSGLTEANKARARPKTASGTVKRRKKRILSVEARNRIAEAQRKRWVAQNKAAKKIATAKSAVKKTKTARPKPAKAFAARTIKPEAGASKS